MKRLLVTLTIALALGTVTAAYAAHGQEYIYVKKVNVTDNYLHITVPGNLDSAHGCSKPYYARSQFPLSDERTKAWMQIALTSFVAKKQVYITTSGCTSYGYPIMTGLQLQQD